MNKFRYLETDCFLVEGELKNVRLLQTKIAKLSTIKCNEGTIKSITNCSFGTTEYVLGRDQGDERNNTYGEADNGKYAEVVIKNDGTYKAGKFNCWDYTENVVAGFTPYGIVMNDGQDCEIYTTATGDGEAICKAINPRTAFAILKDNRVVQFVCQGRTTEQRGMTANEVRTCLKERYDNIDILAILDGGGSSEMVVDGEIVNDPTDGNERALWNGLAIIETEEETEAKQKAIHPIRAMIGVTQGMNGSTSHVGLKAIDFGWNSKYDNSKVLYAPFDGKVVARIGTTNTIAFQSNEPVIWADGTKDYMTVITAHDNNAPALNSEFKQGEVYSHMGTATGVACHCHLEVQKGKYQKYTESKKTGQYYSLIFPNTVEPYKALFLASGTVLGKSAMYDWVYEEEEQEETTDTNYNELLAKYNELNEKNNELNTKYENAMKELESAQNKIEKVKEIVNV